MRPMYRTIRVMIRLAKRFARFLFANAPCHVACLLTFAFLLTAMSGCSAASKRRDGKRYDLKGKVLSVDKASEKVRVDHEEIPGFMEAMAMDFTLEDRDALQVLEAGDWIQATLVVSDEGYWLEHPVITKGVPGESGPPASLLKPRPGEEVVNVSLVNQNGSNVSIEGYEGRALLLTFIYTRCPLAEYCPLMSERFADIHGELLKDDPLRAKTKLLSVTIDPQRDTPEVLRSYGAAHTGRYDKETFETWEFATGKPEEIRRLAQFFGLEYFEDKDQIIHTLVTALINPEGRVHKIYRGNDWKPEQVLNDLRALQTSHH